MKNNYIFFLLFVIGCNSGKSPLCYRIDKEKIFVVDSMNNKKHLFIEDTRNTIHIQKVNKEQYYISFTIISDTNLYIKQLEIPIQF